MVIMVCVTFLVFACNDEDDSIEPNTEKLTITIGQTTYNDLQKKVDSGIQSDSDPFTLQQAVISKGKLLIDVWYSGGCSNHTFELFWPEQPSQIYPFKLVVYLAHNAHGDLCEAAISETLVVDLKGNDLMYDDSTIDQLEIEIVNAFDTSNSVSTND